MGSVTLANSYKFNKNVLLVATPTIFTSFLKAKGEGDRDRESESEKVGKKTGSQQIF